MGARCEILHRFSQSNRQSTLVKDELTQANAAASHRRQQTNLLLNESAPLHNQTEN